MSQKVHNYWNQLLSTSIVENHCFYSLDELDNIPEKPGIYAWYILAEQPSMTDYHKVFKQKKVKISIQGNLSEGYSGEAKSIYKDRHFESSMIDPELCRIASLAFSPPLYIGISKNLKVRLKVHEQELIKIYLGKVNLETPPPLGKTEFDTIVESSHFAQRIGHTLRLFESIRLSSLLIRTIEMPSEYTWQDLQKVERYLNRTYTPIYGRK